VPLWWAAGDPTQIAIDIVPSLLGLSLGAMAVILAFPSSSLFRHFAEDGREDSYYMDLSARLAHFIFVQVVTLLVAVFTKAFAYTPIKFLTAWALYYALLTAAVVALELFGVARIYNVSARHGKNGADDHLP
jgi:phosphate starvation-inducible membrane PsiE